jgi:hypothetical protein
MVRKISVSKMGSAGTEVEITGKPTYRQIVAAAGFSTFKAIMANTLGYVNPDHEVDDSVTMLVLAAPKFDAGYGAIPSIEVEDDDGNVYTLTPSEPVPAEPEPTATAVAAAPATRTISVSKMGSSGTTVTITSTTTYRQAVAMAGFETFKAIMSNTGGYVNPDDEVDPSVTMLVLAAPKFDAGYGAIPSIEVEDDDGNVYTLTPQEPVATATATVAAPAATRTISVSKMGSSGTTVTITATTTYRQAVALAGFETFKAIMSNTGGYVNPDDEVDPSVTMLVLAAPKFDAGN